MAGTIPLILSLADELNDHLYYRNYPQRPYHHHHPSLSLVGPAFNLMHKANCNKNECTAPPPTPVVGKNGFQASIDVQQYKPNELTVKTVDNCIVVEGKHEEREDEHGDIFRHFIRRYVLPEGYDPKDVVSTLSSDGILTVKVAPPQPAESKERIINIQHTGPAHLSVKDNASEEKKPEEEKKKPAEEKKQKK